MTEYGRIHTDGSRSGGQPLHSDVERVARALAQADGIEICSDATYALSSYGHKAQAALAAMRQPTQSDAEIIAENKRLREAMRTVEQGVPRLVGKSWFPDGRPSKHDQCVHGIWMYEPCEGCTDAFIAEALGETK